MKNGSEEIRLRYLYRSLILNGKARLSFESARGLIGPDCAYHLYGAIASGTGTHRKRSVARMDRRDADKPGRKRR